jgi:hypothetical protein
MKPEDEYPTENQIKRSDRILKGKQSRSSKLTTFLKGLKEEEWVHLGEL